MGLSLGTRIAFIKRSSMLFDRRLQNAVFHLLRKKRPEEWMMISQQPARRQEPLAYIVKIQVS